LDEKVTVVVAKQQTGSFLWDTL